jgi:hypothetical protein
MVKKFDGYDAIVIRGGQKAIEPGGYVCKVQGVKIESFRNCEAIKVRLDIVEGEYMGFYKKRYESDRAKTPDAKWGGVFLVFLPRGDDSEKDAYTKQAFKRFMTAVERSNDGYKWDWDENSLVGKYFGGVFGREQYLVDGTPKFSTKCRFVHSVDAIRSGKFKVPADKLLQGYAPQAAAPSPSVAQQIGNLADFETVLSDGEVPF